MTLQPAPSAPLGARPPSSGATPRTTLQGPSWRTTAILWRVR
jgi:hypothetical protein